MKKQALSILLFFLISMQTLHAQDISYQITNLISQSEAACHASDFTGALRYLDEATSKNGHSNLRIQYLYAKIYVGLKRWQKGKTEIQKYYTMHPSTDASEYGEIKRLEQQVNEQINLEDNLYRQAIENKDIDIMNVYLLDYPEGKYYSVIKNAIEGLKGDAVAWQIAKNKSNTKAYFDYIDLYPGGLHAIEAQQRIDSWDKAAYSKSLELNTQYALKYYLTNYPRGRYRKEVKQQLAINIEEDTYQKAVSSRKMADYENYLDEYPAGRYVLESKKILKSAYIFQAKRAEGDKNWKLAKNYYHKYLYRFPNGAETSKATKGLKKCDRRQKQSGAFYMTYVYERNAGIGIAFGELKTKGLGFYTHIRLNTAYLKGYKSLWTIDNSGNSNSPWALSPLNEYAYGNLKVSYGYSWKLFYPFWLHGGLGFALKPVYQHIGEIDGSGQLYETVWMKRTDLSASKLFWEVGTDFKIGESWLFKIGLESISSKNVYQFGVGFAF